MNLRKIKLALTVDLINRQQKSSLSGIRKVMTNMKEVGAYIGEVLVNNEPITANLTKETYAIQFENCTLDIEFFKNSLTGHPTVQGFNVH